MLTNLILPDKVYTNFEGLVDDGLVEFDCAGPPTLGRSHEAIAKGLATVVAKEKKDVSLMNAYQECSHLTCISEQYAKIG